jgi:hypothetical protein
LHGLGERTAIFSLTAAWVDTGKNKTRCDAFFGEVG